MATSGRLADECAGIAVASDLAPFLPAVPAIEFGGLGSELEVLARFLFNIPHKKRLKTHV